MNLPTGVFKAQGQSSRQFDAKKELDILARDTFSGYLILSTLSEIGVDEGALLFRVGQGMGGVFEYHGVSKILYGSESLPHVFNAMAAEHTVIDIVSLSLQQVDLVMAFNGKLALSKPLSKGQFSPFIKPFDPQLIRTVLQGTRP
ncbi:MAG: hypothetical protein U1C71_02820, partial [archaeon]|nr:hypothetical protein [archaeon]